MPPTPPASDPSPFEDDATRVLPPGKAPAKDAPIFDPRDIDDDSTRVVGPSGPQAPARAVPPTPAAPPPPLNHQTEVEPGDQDATRVQPRGRDFLASAFPETAAHDLRHGVRGSGAPQTSAPGTSPTGALPGQMLSSTASLAAGGSKDAPVRQVGRYLIQSRLGRGGMATVYLAHDPSINRNVAIKFLHASLAEDEECHSRFLAEARAAGGLSHPNVVVVHDVGEIEGRPYMAMELIDGLPLADVLDKTKQLPIRDAVRIGIQLARALDYAHGRGIVHRDIKPGNIMVLKDGRSVKVTDFGIAHIDDGGNQRTQVGAVLGTPQYMSPEQTRGDKLDGRSDLFSAGIVLYQMISGERPFRGDSLVAIATKIANDAATPLTQLRPDAPAALRRIVDRCLAKTPAQRYQSGQELADALQKVLAEIDEAAREKNKPRIVPLRIKWALSMAAIIAVVMGISATIITQRQYAALMGQATDYGESLARFIARQNAAAALSEDWDVVDVAVQEMMKTGNFERIVVIDPKGVVRAASVGTLVGQPYKSAGTESLGKLAGGGAAVRYQANNESVLGFEAPVTFQETVVGRVALGIPEKPLTQVAQLSISLMVILALVTVLAVAVAMYFLADWFAKPIRLLSDSMAEIAKGRFSHRIAEQRKDEFGQLFADFDAMALALQQREGGAEGVTHIGLATPAPITGVPASNASAAAGTPPKT
jgi:serine/threonine-protein kinase